MSNQEMGRQDTETHIRIAMQEYGVVDMPIDQAGDMYRAGYEAGKQEMYHDITTYLHGKIEANEVLSVYKRTKEATANEKPIQT